MGIMLYDMRRDALEKVRGIKKYTDKDKKVLFDTLLCLDVLNEKMASEDMIGYDSIICELEENGWVSSYLKKCHEYSQFNVEEEDFESCFSGIYYIEDPQGFEALAAFFAAKGLMTIWNPNKVYSWFDFKPYISDEYIDECHRYIGDYKRKIKRKEDERKASGIDGREITSNNDNAKKSATLLETVLTHLDSEEIERLMYEIMDVDIAYPMVLMDKKTQDYVLNALDENKSLRIRAEMGDTIFGIQGGVKNFFKHDDHDGLDIFFGEITEEEKELISKDYWYCTKEDEIEEKVEKIFHKLAALKKHGQIEGNDPLLERLSKVVSGNGIMGGMSMIMKYANTMNNEEDNSETMSFEDKIKNVTNKG